MEFLPKDLQFTKNLQFTKYITNLPEEVLIIIKEFTIFKPQTNEELKEAVDLWCSSNKKKALEKYNHISVWDTCLITDMRKLFDAQPDGHYKVTHNSDEVKDYKYYRENFNDDISNWDVSNVEEMYRMFHRCKKFNQPLNNWDVSKVRSMITTFKDCKDFNQPLNKWNTSNVKRMENMFIGCESFNQDISDWDVSNVYDMEGMFCACSKFNQPLNNWDVSKVDNMMAIFMHCEDFNQPLDKWNVSKATNIAKAFHGCKNFNQNINDWDVSRNHDMTDMFQGCKKFNQPLDKWNVSNVEYMHRTFAGCYKFNQDINAWNVSKVEDMEMMFEEAYNFDQPLNKWNVSSCEDMSHMFRNAKKFNQDISGWDTSRVRDMDYMFHGCSNFNQDLTAWDVSTISDFKIYQMFCGCERLEKRDKWFDESNFMMIASIKFWCRRYWGTLKMPYKVVLVDGKTILVTDEEKERLVPDDMYGIIENHELEKTYMEFYDSFPYPELDDDDKRNRITDGKRGWDPSWDSDSGDSNKQLQSQLAEIARNNFIQGTNDYVTSLRRHQEMIGAMCEEDDEMIEGEDIPSDFEGPEFSDDDDDNDVYANDQYTWGNGDEESDSTDEESDSSDEDFDVPWTRISVSLEDM